jgi:pyruvate dehydrogenase E2 component (dihydrolipoamide acetyltransferase)
MEEAPTAREERQFEHKLPGAPQLAPLGESGKVLATPATRKLARDLGIDLSTVAPSGPNGRVTHDDVRAAAEHPSRGRRPAERPAARREEPRPHVEPEPLEAVAAPTGHTQSAAAIVPPPVPLHVESVDERLPFRGVRRKIAENMHRSRATAAHFTYVDECDMTELVALRKRARARAEERGIRLSYLPFIVKAVCAGLKKHPIVNATLDEANQEIILRKRYHVGVATATPDGLIVPVLRDADQKSLFDLASTLEQLSEKVRTGRASRDEITGSTFTISSLGTLGGLLATPIINFPEVAILGVHKIKPTPAVREGQIVVREIMNLSLSLDHRIVDGYEGAQFLAHVISLLEDPTLMFMEMV